MGHEGGKKLPKGSTIVFVIIQQPKALQILLCLVLITSRSPFKYSIKILIINFLITLLVDRLIYDHLPTHYFNGFFLYLTIT